MVSLNILWCLVYKFLGYRKQNTYTRSETFHTIKCAHRGRRFILIKVRAHVYYLFPIGNENLFSSQSLHISLCLLNLELPLTKIVPFSIMFDRCENGITRIQLPIPFFAKGGNVVFKVFNLFQIQ